MVFRQKFLINNFMLYNRLVEVILEKWHRHAKHSKADAGYQARPRNGQICKHCTMFRAPNACTAVEGYINPRGWCEWYKRSKLSKGHE
jgi:hypothetical protein